MGSLPSEGVLRCPFTLPLCPPTMLFVAMLGDPPPITSVGPHDDRFRAEVWDSASNGREVRGRRRLTMGFAALEGEEWTEPAKNKD